MNTKSLTVFILLFSLSTALFAQDAKQVSVKYAQETATPYESVILQGDITAQLDWDEFVFSDGTGSIKLELEGPSKYDINHQGLMGSTVRVYGVVDKEHQWDRAEIKVFKMRVVGGGSKAAVKPVADAPANVKKETPKSAPADGDINMEGRDDLAEAFENAYGHGGPASNIPDNF